MLNKTNELKIGDEVYCIFDKSEELFGKNIFDFHYKMPWKAIIDNISEFDSCYCTIVIKEQCMTYNQIDIKDIYKTEEEALKSYLEKIGKQKRTLYDRFANLHREEIKIVQNLIRLEDDKL